MQTFQYAQIAQHIEPAGDAAEVQYLLSEMTDEFRAHLASIGFRFDDATQTVTIDDPSVLEKVLVETNRIYEEYENLKTDEPDSYWVKFKLGGDDSVDYNSGYIEAIVVAIMDNLM